MVSLVSQSITKFPIGAFAIIAASLLFDDERRGVFFGQVSGFSLVSNNNNNAIGRISDNNNLDVHIRRNEYTKIFQSARAKDDTATSSASDDFEKAVQDAAMQDEGLSDLDAQVLQSLLEDNIDLAMENNLKRLLEKDKEAKLKRQQTSTRARTANANTTSTSSTQENNKKYASKTLNTIKDESFWNSIRAKADSLLESASIFLSNKIERDSQLLAALGLFTIDRIKRDVARALPAVSTNIKKGVVFLLSNETSAGDSSDGKDGQNLLLLLPGVSSFAELDIDDDENNKRKPKSLYEEFNTPEDEIREVTQTIKAILSGKSTIYSINPQDTKNGNGSNYKIFQAAQNKGKSYGVLRSLTPGGRYTKSGNVERQKKAFQRRKETTLKRQKESRPDQILTRLVGDVSNSAYELSQEMKVVKPGYKSEKMRTKLLEGTNNVQRFLGAATAKNKNILGGSSKSSPSSVNDDVVKKKSSSGKAQEVSFTDVTIETTTSEETSRKTPMSYYFMNDKGKITQQQQDNEVISSDTTDIGFTTVPMASPTSRIDAPVSSPLFTDDYTTIPASTPLATETSDLVDVEVFSSSSTQQEVEEEVMETSVYSFDDEEEFDVEFLDGDDDQDILLDVQVVEDIEFLEEEILEKVKNDEEPGFAVAILLRTLDVGLYVGEKVFLVGVPGAIQSSQRAINRVNEAKQGGLGKEGWDVLNNVQNGKNRY